MRRADVHLIRNAQIETAGGIQRKGIEQNSLDPPATAFHFLNISHSRRILIKELVLPPGRLQHDVKRDVLVSGKTENVKLVCLVKFGIFSSLIQDLDHIRTPKMEHLVFPVLRIKRPKRVTTLVICESERLHLSVLV